MLVSTLTSHILAILWLLCSVTAVATSHHAKSCDEGSTAPHCHKNKQQGSTIPKQDPKPDPNPVPTVPKPAPKPADSPKPKDSPVTPPPKTEDPKPKEHPNSGQYSSSNPIGKNQKFGAVSGYATTTLYNDKTGGACGCFDRDSSVYKDGYEEQWSLGTGIFMAAASDAIFTANEVQIGNRWCGNGCGKCYKLESQGYSACHDCGRGTDGTPKITVAVLDMCPPSDERPYHYCAPKGTFNAQGYESHFDIHAKDFNLGIPWDNPVVKYQLIDCPPEVTKFMSKCTKQCPCCGHDGKSVPSKECAQFRSFHPVMS